MRRITINHSTYLQVEARATFGRLSEQGTIFNNNDTVSIEIDDELYQILDAQRDDITPTFDDVLQQILRGSANG